MRVLILFLFICYYGKSFSQEIDVYFNLRTPNIALIEAAYSLDSSNKIGVNGSYTFAYSREQYWSGYSLFAIHHDITRSFNRKGFGGSVYYDFKQKKDRNRISLEYRHIKSDNYIDDVGKFSGSNTNDYSEFKDTYNSLAVFYSMYPRTKSKYFNLFLESGVEYRFVKRAYSIQGSYDSQQPSNKVEKFNSIIPLIRLGLQIKLGTINKE